MTLLWQLLLDTHRLAIGALAIAALGFRQWHLATEAFGYSRPEPNNPM